MHAHTPQSPKNPPNRLQQLRDLHSPSRGLSFNPDEQPSSADAPLRAVDGMPGKDNMQPTKKQPEIDFNWEGLPSEKVRDYPKKS